MRKTITTRHLFDLNDECNECAKKIDDGDIDDWISYLISLKENGVIGLRLEVVSNDDDEYTVRFYSISPETEEEFADRARRNNDREDSAKQSRRLQYAMLKKEFDSNNSEG